MLLQLPLYTAIGEGMDAQHVQAGPMDQYLITDGYCSVLWVVGTYLSTNLACYTYHLRTRPLHTWVRG